VYLQNPKFNKMKNSIYNKLFQLQSEIGSVSKKQNNPFFNSGYFDINALIEVLQPLLKKYELVLIQPIVDGCVKTIISDLDGNSVESELPLPLTLDAPKVGAAITYFRRYSLVSLLALRAVDDDGNSTMGTPVEVAVTDDVFTNALNHLKKQTPQKRPMVLEKIRKEKGDKITAAQYKKLEAIK
tara:strand:- start:642 stop:1193 length:552 start_codon:yes stop_codon:yes gene_type:complete